MHLIVQFRRRVVVAIDVPANACAAQQVEIVRPRQQSAVVDLWHAGSEELEGARNQIFVVTRAEGIVKGAIDLVKIEVAGRGAGGLAARALAALVNRFDEGVDLFGRKQAGQLVLLISGRADIEHADSIVRVEHRDGVARADFEPAFEMAGIAPVQRVQDKRRQREVVDPIGLLCDFDLFLIMRMDFDQHFDFAGVGLRLQFRDEIERFGNHEGTCAGLLDRVADGVQTNDANARVLKLIENTHQVVPARGMANVDVDLPGSEGGPEQMLGAVSEACLCKGKAGARAIDAEQVRLAHAFGENAAESQKHSGEGRIFASLLEIQELWRAVGDVVDDEIGHDLHMAAERANVVPGAEARVDLRVIDGIEARIGAVDRPEEGQQVNATEQPGERPVQQTLKLTQAAAGEAIDIRNQLDLVLHVPSR